MNRFALALATVFGCGYFPKGPGTVGSLAGLAVAVLLQEIGFGRWTLLVLVLVFVTPAIWSATLTARMLDRKDPGQVVIDEVLGQWVSLLGAATWNWKSFLAAFLKPPPVRTAESLPEGMGIVADDLMAGIYSALVLYTGVHLKIV
jgi:phosphatidylglycerophosphatase A